MTVADRKRKARIALYRIPFDTRTDIEKWLDKNLLIGEGNCTTERIVTTLIKNFGEIEKLHEMVEWYLFSHDIEYKYSDGVLAWNLQIENSKNQKASEANTDDLSVPEDDEHNNSSSAEKRQEPNLNSHTEGNAVKDNVDGAKKDKKEADQAETNITVSASQDVTPTEATAPAPDENTIEQSKQQYGDWVGLRSWLTKNSFNKSRSNRTTYPLQTVMDYYNFEKGQHPISFEFLRDRLLNDGFKESKTDKPLPQREFNITLPNMKLRRRFRKSKEKRQKKEAKK